MVRRYRDGVVPEVEPDPELASDFDGLAERVAELLDGAQLTPALDEIWQRVRRLNRYVEERAPWQLAKDEAKAGELDVALRSLAEGLRVVAVLLHAYMPASTEKALAALGQPETSFDAARYGAGAGRGERSASSSRCSRRPSDRVIDSHAHLDHCSPRTTPI